MSLSRSNNRYLRTIVGLVYDNRCGVEYGKLMDYLYSREFYWSEYIPMDRNRALDGIMLREKYGYLGDIDAEPCSVLEMIIALAVRIENQFMTNYEDGDRTSTWFWIMLTNLGLNHMDDEHFDISEVEYIIDRLLDRMYGPNGEGGLFVVNNPRQDMRDVEIWYQANWYLSEQDGYL